MKLYVILLAAMTITANVMANIFETNDTQRANLDFVKKWDAENAKLAGTANSFLARALVADKSGGTVTVLAEACDVALGTTIEFPIVGELSDRDYESAFRTFAKPGDIAKALEWLGMPRGVNVSAPKIQFWAKGERVKINVTPLKSPDAKTLPIQQYLLDRVVGSFPEWDSFVYCGSPDDPESKDGKRLADAVAPNSVLSTYNEPQTVIDTPVISNQAEVYERFVLAKDAPFKPFDLYKITFTVDKRADGQPRVKEDEIEFLPVNDAVCGNSKSENKTFEMPELLKRFKSLAENGFDQHVAVKFNESMTIRQAAGIAALLEKIEGDKGIRIAPPPAGTFYFKGFMPNNDWRNFKDRLSQPWEAHFTTNSASVRLVQTIEDWSDKTQLDPKLTQKEYTISSPEEVKKLIASEDSKLAKNMRLPVFLVFAPENAPLSVFMPTVRALLSDHPLVYIFSE